MQGLDETEKHDSAFIDTNWIPKVLLYTAIIAATVEGTQMGAKHVAHTQNVKLILLWIVKAPLKYYRFGWIWHLSLTQRYGIAEEHTLN